MNKKHVLIFGVIAAAVLVYLWWKSKNSVSVSTPSASNISDYLNSAGTRLAVTTALNPATGQTTKNWKAAGGTLDIPLAVQQWVQTLGPQNQAQFMKMMPAMDWADINGLLDLVVNGWGVGAHPSQAETEFFNNWCITYGFPVGGGFDSFKGRKRSSHLSKA